MSNFTYHHISLDSQQEFTDRATAELEQAICDSIEDHGNCAMGLSGGSTPRKIYEELGKLVAVEWGKVTIFLLDERYISADDYRSNQKLVRDTLLKNAKIPEHQIIFPNTSLPIEECVEEYGNMVEGLGHVIDIVILGLGPDGHIASLFPGDRDEILNRDQAVIHTQTDEFDVHNRITVTIPVLESSVRQFFFLNGKGKQKVFDEMISAEENPVEYPAHYLLKAGNTIWVTCFE